MAGVPTSGDMSMLKVARERTGSGYESSISIAPPIYLSDLSRLSGGNSSGSGRSYPAINLNNQADQRPDGQNPLRMEEFKGYQQNLTRTPFYYVYSSQNSSGACLAAFPLGPYFHTDSNNLYPDNLTGIYTAYTTQTGTTPVSSGYYAIYDSFFNSTGKWIYVGSNGSITGGGSC